jgi:hypothetical protein
MKPGNRRPVAWSIPLEELHRRYMTGESAKELAAACEHGDGVTLANHFRRRGWQMRPKAESMRLNGEKRRTRLDEDQFRSLYAAGRTHEEIAELMGTTPKIVSTTARRLEMPPRSRASRPERNRFWGGGYKVDKHGYILVRMPDHREASSTGYVRVHRWVMEQHLGRPLAPGEVVDHRDDDTSNNDPSNLRAFPSNGEHLRVTRTGRPQIPREEREALRREAVRRGRRRVAAIRTGSGTDADPSLAWWPRPSTAPRTTPPSP